MIGATIPPVRILERIRVSGRGVFCPVDVTRLKRTVAMKFLPPELTRGSETRERLIHEDPIR